MFKRIFIVFSLFFHTWALPVRAEIPESIRIFLRNIEVRFEAALSSELARSQVYSDLNRVFSNLTLPDELWAMPASAATQTPDQIAQILSIIRRVRHERQATADDLARLRGLNIPIDFGINSEMSNDEGFQQFRNVSSDKIRLEILDELTEIIRRVPKKNFNRTSWDSVEPHTLLSLPAAAFYRLRLDIADFKAHLLRKPINDYIHDLHAIYKDLLRLISCSEDYDFPEKNRNQLVNENRFIQPEQVLLLKLQSNLATPPEKVELALTLQSKVRRLIWGLTGHSSTGVRQTIGKMAEWTFIRIVNSSAGESFVVREEVRNAYHALEHWHEWDCQNAIRRLVL